MVISKGKHILVPENLSETQGKEIPIRLTNIPDLTDPKRCKKSIDTL